jgi:hypothetical protein
LTKRENAPYDFADIQNSTTAQNGTSLGAHCEDAQGASWSGGSLSCDGDAWESSDTWDVGQTIWAPCYGAGNHVVSVSISGTTVLDQSVECDEDVTTTT